MVLSPLSRGDIVWYHSVMSTNRKATLIRLTEQDIEIINRLKEHHGVTSTNEVLRMALRSALRELPTGRGGRLTPT